MPWSVACPGCGQPESVVSVADLVAAGPTPVSCADYRAEPSQLRTDLAPPIYPPSRLTRLIPWLLLIWFVIFALVEGWIFFAPTLELILNPVPYVWFAGFWTPLGISLALLFVFRRRTNPEAVALWAAAHYCRNDDLVFIPGYPYRATPAEFATLLRERPHFWPLRKS